MAIGLGQRSASLGSGKVEHTGRPVVHFGSPAPADREEKRAALQDLFGGEVSDATADRVIMRTVTGGGIVRSVN